MWMENGKFYYVRLSACVRVLSVFSLHFASDMCVIVVIAWSAYRIIISIFGSIVCVYVPIVIRFISWMFECSNGWRIVTAFAAAAIDVVRTYMYC